jgi:putative SOS response-associated peptidase YedK
VITDGFYEWKKNGKVKQPYRIAMKNDGLFVFAGLWDEWKDPEGKTISSFTIITTEASEKIQPIHNRMPVIFEMENEKRWLDENLLPEDAIQLLKPYHKENLIAYPISTAVNNPRNNSEEIWNKEGEIEMPTLF